MSDSLVLSALARLEAGETTLEADTTGPKAEQARLRSDFLAEPGKTRADIMERVDRLESAVTLIRDDIAVNIGAAEAVERARENTRADVRTLGRQVSVMWKQIKQLQSEMREVHGDPDRLPQEMTFVLTAQPA
jgi:chromosome segregation ATPase